MLQGRSPSLDLDSLYGAGPATRLGEVLEADRRKLRVGKPGAGVERQPGREAASTCRARAQGATIPDFRNDENLAVAQTHLAFIRFHNRVVDGAGSRARRPALHARPPPGVVKHYQWMIRHDYLPRICDPAVVDDVFANGRKVFEAGADPTEVPTMPVEFSVAAFRLGHSMIRAKYSWNVVFHDGGGTLRRAVRLLRHQRLPRPGHRAARATGRRLAAPVPTSRRPARGLKVARPAKFNRAMRIDTRLVDPLATLPLGSFGAQEASPPTRWGQPRVPQPRAGQHGAARHRPGHGREAAGQGRRR